MSCRHKNVSKLNLQQNPLNYLNFWPLQLRTGVKEMPKFKMNNFQMHLSFAAVLISKNCSKDTLYTTLARLWGFCFAVSFKISFPAHSI